MKEIGSFNQLGTPSISILIPLLLFLFFWFVVRVADSIWWRPKRLEKLLKQQGIKGTPCKLLHGDMKEHVRLITEARSKPMSLNHQIPPRVMPSVHATVQKYGSVSLSWLRTRPRLTITDPELIKLVLMEKSSDFQKPPQNPLIDLLQLGVSTLDGEAWARRRKMIAPAFHQEKLKGMIPAFSTSCSNLIDRWKRLVVPQGSCELDVWPELQNFSSDIIARAGFGSSYEEGMRVFELQKQQAILVIEAYQSFYFPGLRFVPTKKNQMRYKLDKEIKGMLREMIHRRSRAMSIGESSGDDLLGLLVECSNLSARNSNKDRMTVADIIEECKLFYFAGQETTATWLTWTMILLAMHPNWQEKAKEEVLQVCGKGRPDMEAMNDLKIVTMILNEVLRLYPPVVNLMRYTSKVTKLREISLPAGVELYFPFLLVHHDPEIWGNNAEEFKPERFAGGVSKASKDQAGFYPFGWGPRFCLGQSFAMMEAKMGLAMILQTSHSSSLPPIHMLLTPL